MTLDEILNDLYLKIHTADDARDLVDEIMRREISAHVAAEREACAKVCSSKSEEWYARTSNRQHNSSAAIGADACAAAIRARGAA